MTSTRKSARLEASGVPWPLRTDGALALALLLLNAAVAVVVGYLAAPSRPDVGAAGR